jgi:hypothetical protein
MRTNLLLVGSLASIRVVERAADFGVNLSFAERTGSAFRSPCCRSRSPSSGSPALNWLRWLPEA